MYILYHKTDTKTTRPFIPQLTQWAFSAVFCKKEVEFLVRLCDSLSVPNKNVEDIFTMTLTDRLIMRLEANRDCTNEILKWADGLPQWGEATSGIIAIHDRCYNQNESVQKKASVFGARPESRLWTSTKKVCIDNPPEGSSFRLFLYKTENAIKFSTSKNINRF